MKIATAAYPLDLLSGWAAYEDKLSAWVDEAASHGADLLVFPEYAAMELATLAGLDVALDDIGALLQGPSPQFVDCAKLKPCLFLHFQSTSSFFKTNQILRL